jgi:hypothetical protein
MLGNRSAEMQFLWLILGLESRTMLHYFGLANVIVVCRFESVVSKTGCAAAKLKYGLYQARP